MGIRAGLHAALMDAVRRRDVTGAAALRSALAAIDNAGAVPAPEPPGAAAGPFARSIAGLGAAETPRRELTEAEVSAIVGREVSERQAAADLYEAAGHPEDAARLRAEAAVLTAHLAGG